ncbi:helix-turn-helix domain-containing protein [Sorangium sp. So ce1389]|uniref:AraC family transcriptional regulator n=1 Tax=Sorangium sp. So ce1389 TaxID=3133336 RepID=UPI003F6388FF
MLASTRRHRLAPSASIAPAVEALFVNELTGDAPHVLIPRPEIELVFRFGPAAPRGLDAHALGARQQVRRKVPRGVRRTVTARLRLGASEAVLGVPASALAGRIVAFVDLWGDEATRRLFDRLAGARDALDAAAIVDRAIAERLARASEARRAVAPLALVAANKLRDDDSSHVNAIADDLGVSERHLRRVFRDAVGVGPKAFAKLARFDRALRAAREDDGAGWATIAAAAGYYDQAHLIAEFRAIAGATPRALLHELRAAPSIG